MSGPGTATRASPQTGWEDYTLDDLVRSPIRTGLSKTGRPDSDKKCLTLSAVRGRTLILGASKPVDVSDSEAAGNWVRPGCFYVVRGNGNRELVGRGGFAPDPLPHPVLFPDLLFQLDLGERVNPDFFWCLWSSAPVRRAIEERARTAAGIYKINTANLSSLRLRLPPLTEQQRIAAELTVAMSAVDRARRAAEERLAAAEALPAAYLREVFEGPEASGWDAARVGDISQVGGGIQKTPDRAPQHHHRPYLTVRNVQRGYLDLSQIERFEITSAELERLRLQPGDVLIVEGNGSVDHIGRNAVFNLGGEEWIHQNHIIRVRLAQSRSRSEFVALYLNSDAGKRQMVEKARSTSGLYTLSVDKVASLTVPLPPLAEQQRIGVELTARLEAAEEVIARCREELAAIEALPAALLREAFGSEA